MQYLDSYMSTYLVGGNPGGRKGPSLPWPSTICEVPTQCPSLLVCWLLALPSLVEILMQHKMIYDESIRSKISMCM